MSYPAREVTISPDSRPRLSAGSVVSKVAVWVGAAAAIALFLFAVRLLGTATEAVAPVLAQLLNRVVTNAPSALGASWLATYAVTNGSVVAAIAVTFYEAGLVTASQLFLMVTGSRLGSSGIVVLVGGLEYLQTGRRSVRESTSLGVLSFIVTQSIYLPATVLGYASLRWLVPVFSLSSIETGSRSQSVVGVVADALVDVLGAGGTFVLAVLLLFGSLKLVDRVLGDLDIERLQNRYLHKLDVTWVSFGLGLVVTGLTASVAFSLGIVVPLYNRGFLSRDDVVPYILGANLSTFVDTILVAVLLDSVSGLSVVLSLLAVTALFTVGALGVYRRYFSFVDGLQTRILADRRVFLAFFALLVVIPGVLVVAR